MPQQRGGLNAVVASRARVRRHPPVRGAQDGQSGMPGEHRRAPRGATHLIPPPARPSAAGWPVPYVPLSLRLAHAARGPPQARTGSPSGPL